MDTAKTKTAVAKMRERAAAVADRYAKAWRRKEKRDREMGGGFYSSVVSAMYEEVASEIRRLR